jgi:hypothetical protein
MFKTKELFRLDATLETLPLGMTPLGMRLIANIISGSIAGERVNGTILRSGADWLTIGSNGVFNMDVRLAFQADDDSLVYMTYAGRLHAPPEVLGALGSPDYDGSIDPAEYYFRIAPVFETASQKYAWLNQIVAIGEGKRTASGVAYTVWEVE